MRPVGTQETLMLAPDLGRLWLRTESRKGVRHVASGRVNAALHFASGTPHLCGPSGPERLERSRRIRVGSGFGPKLEKMSATEHPAA
jgi:hypothetical protein